MTATNSALGWIFGLCLTTVFICAIVAALSVWVQSLRRKRAYREAKARYLAKDIDYDTFMSTVFGEIFHYRPLGDALPDEAEWIDSLKRARGYEAVAQKMLGTWDRYCTLADDSYGSEGTILAGFALWEDAQRCRNGGFMRNDETAYKMFVERSGYDPNTIGLELAAQIRSHYLKLVRRAPTDLEALTELRSLIRASESSNEEHWKYARISEVVEPLEWPAGWEGWVCSHFENPTYEQFGNLRPANLVASGAIRAMAASALVTGDTTTIKLVLAYCNRWPERHDEIGDSLLKDLALHAARAAQRATHL